MARLWRGLMPAPDVFVFPSLTDTFGLVILEALACGTPVAAFPVTGPKDVLMNADGKIGAVDADLRIGGAGGAERGPGGLPGCMLSGYSWRACAEIFLSHLVPLMGAQR